MQRRAYAPSLAALVALLATGLGGCTSGSADGGAALDSKTGAAAGAEAAPGRYSTLFEPCGSVGRTLLQELLPGATELPPEQRDRVLRGAASVTYDSSRRAGCSWKADGAAASHQLTLDFERVVSYDPAVSDDDRAQEVFATKEAEAGLPARTPDASAGAVSPSASGGPSATADTGGGPQAQTAAPAPSTSAGASAPAAPAPSATPDELLPRALEGLGDIAFLNDVVTPAGATAQQRTVSVVFRTSNVLVTVRYAAQAARVGEVPDSEELQDKARRLARQLADRFEE
ncbi:DUF3558 domain-containing protein [Streptomyces sp. CC210A]|uniref:DUF3558 domain-containing protein n=1 Tax=Streptomyces sp. CC210A TaxID=2898184 RepID=UPI001F21073F|nr:DUF3558 domain-containing protein [Streptomyces sp. CC210A]